MKKFLALALAAGFLASVVQAGPVRVAVLEFTDATGMKAEALQGGLIAPGAMAEKGVFITGKTLASQPGFTLVDRRDLLAQMEKLAPKDQGERTPTKPSFLQAAQALKADVVLRGSILSLSSGKQVINQGGSQAELSTMSLRVGFEALDAVDGAVIAAADGVARHSIRQTSSLQTQLGEDDLYQLMEKAVADAVPKIQQALDARQVALEARATVKLTVTSTADPAMVEVDGLLVGSTPLENLEVYQGDHVLTVGKPGYQQVTKRILLEKDTRVEVPMLREQLTADELKEIYEKIQLKVISVDPGMIIHTVE